MLKNISYKKRNQVFLWGGVALFLLIYKLTFSKTIALYSECIEMEQRIERASDAPIKIAELKKQSVRLESLAGSERPDEKNLQQLILGQVTSYCQENNVLLKEFPETIIQTEKDYEVETNCFTAEGSFDKLLRLVYVLEQKSKTGKISSVDFKTKLESRTNKLKLTATVYIQNIKKTNGKQKDA
jgi:hypothetical protein